MPTTVRSHAKINLGLGIGAPRPDGFHALATVYQTIELYDLVTVSVSPATTTTIVLTSNDGRVPTDSRNTAWKMVNLALEALHIKASVEVHIEKRLPVQGGLGAGSANAVAALVGLEAELGIEADGSGLPPFEQKAFEGWGSHIRWSARRLEIAAQVGSDVPLFLIGGAVLGLGSRARTSTPFQMSNPYWCVVAASRLGVSTPQAFRDWDTLCAAEGLTAEAQCR